MERFREIAAPILGSINKYQWMVRHGVHVALHGEKIPEGFILVPDNEDFDYFFPRELYMKMLVLGEHPP